MRNPPHRRSAIGGLLAATIAVALTGCGNSKVSPSSATPGGSGGSGTSSSAATASTSGGSTGSGKGKVYDVVVADQSDPFYVKAAAGVKTMASQLGVNAKFQATQDFTQPEETTLLNTLLASHPAGLAVAPVDPQGVVQSLKPWVEAKIPIATFDSTIDGPIPVVTRIATQNFNGGVVAAKALAKSIGGSGEVATLGLNASDVVLYDRQLGFLHELAKDYPNIKVDDKVLSGASDSSVYQSDAQSLVNKFPNLKAIFCTNDVATEAAAQGVQQLGKSGKIQLSGFDGGQALYTLVKNKTVQVLVQQQPAAEAGAALKYLVQHNQGKKVPKTFNFPDVVVTPDNVSSMAKYMY